MRRAGTRRRCRVPVPGQAQRGRPSWGGCRRGEPAEGRTRCRRPSGWVTVPSFSACVSSGKTTSEIAVVAFSKVREGDDVVGGRESRFPCVGVREVPERVDSEEDAATSISPAIRPARISSVPCPSAASVRPGPASGRQPASRRPRALASSGTSSRPAPSLAGELRARRRGRAAPRAPPARARSARPRRSRPCRRHVEPRRPPPGPPPNAPPALSVRRRAHQRSLGCVVRRPGS